MSLALALIIDLGILVTWIVLTVLRPTWWVQDDPYENEHLHRCPLNAWGQNIDWED